MRFKKKEWLEDRQVQVVTRKGQDGWAVVSGHLKCADAHPVPSSPLALLPKANTIRSSEMCPGLLPAARSRLHLQPWTVM